MKNNPVGALLVAALFLCSAVSISLSIHYLVAMRELRSIKAQSVQMNNTMNFLQAFANEALVYSRTNASIDPILAQHGLKTKPAATAVPNATVPGPVRPANR